MNEALLHLKHSLFLIPECENMNYEYTQLMYTWANKQYSIFISITSTFYNIFNIFITPLLSGKLKFKDTSIGFIGLFSMLISLVMKSLAKYPGLFWTCMVFENPLVYMIL